MHELSIAVSVVEIAEEEAEKHGATSVSKVHLRLGPLTGVVKEALLFSYDLATEGTTLAGSKLMIEDSPVEVFCHTCQDRRPVRSLQRIACATCDTLATEILHGRELEVVALEIES